MNLASENFILINEPLPNLSYSNLIDSGIGYKAIFQTIKCALSSYSAIRTNVLSGADNA